MLPAAFHQDRDRESRVGGGGWRARGWRVEGGGQRQTRMEGNDERREERRSRESFSSLEEKKGMMQDGWRGSDHTDQVIT